MGKRYEVNKLHPTDTSIYREDFETQFIDATVEYYSAASERWLEEDSCPEYLRKAEKHIAKETKRLKEFLHGSTEQKLLQALYDTLLLKHQSVVLIERQGIYIYITVITS